MRLIRVAAVFTGLAFAGALFGAFAGLVVAAVLMGSAAGLWSPGLSEIYVVAAAIGAACGVLLAPLASFAFMRRVPLWRLYVETTVGTIIAGALGLRLDLSIAASLAVAAAGFLLAGARLAYAFRNTRQDVPTPSTTEFGR
jgi:hypothetical protein